ncbi:hypothetical protein Aeqsu_1954 [Aequorivita sublithincola DSM 14238]|uniref:Uncharacterized protein n=1 Tax=Aequorivita sublithincola (strain DSM 14238 / LMG 21431 / ACAM 643 / 9-3) TaxID=746697 RepID=I3YWQ9_AEQSU|nr:T9SS type A sorting domain-containing protein [Aequorivita sublithincola]AFL81427.1 hypothetical protein Aeqsu_1954 [Aequorivita sublithincola DSM 14238]
MRKLLLLVFSLAFQLNFIYAQCPTAPLALSTQSEVDNFSVNYPGCTDLPVSLSIIGNNITNLNGLSNIHSISGSLEILASSTLTSLNGLEGLTSITGYLKLRNLSAINDISALNNLTSVGGYIEISSNNNLISIAGLNVITGASGSLRLLSNHRLENVSGLNGVNSLSSLVITDNIALVNLIGFNGVSTINGDFNISNNSVSVINGFSNLGTIGGSLTVNDNDSLTSFGDLEKLQNVEGDITFSNNELLVSIADFDLLETVGGSIDIEKNDVLTHLPNCPNFSTLTGNLKIFLNNSLQDLSGLGSLTSAANVSVNYNESMITFGLESLTTVNGYMHIQKNNALVNINTLDNLVSVSGSLIVGRTSAAYPGNPSLNNISLAQLQTVGGDFIISDNISLTQLDKINSLATVGGRLYILGNNNIENITGFNGLENTIDGIEINNNDSLITLAGFDSLNTIDGRLVIDENETLNSITGFQNLNTINGLLNIYDDYLLTSLIGFSSLTEITGDFYLGAGSLNDGLTSLPNFNGLESLETVGGSLRISGCEIITNLNGFDGLMYVGGDLTIGGVLNSQNANPALQNLVGLESLETVNGELFITSNESLNSLVGMSSLTTVNKSFWIFENNILQNFTGMENLSYIGGALKVDQMDDILNFVGLDNLVEVGALVALNSPSIASFQGLESLEIINNYSTQVNDYGFLKIESCDGLFSLNGLENLNIVHGIRFTGNAVLQDINSIENIDSNILERITMFNNPNLSNCSIISFCNYLNLPNPVITLSNNGPGCNSETEIFDNCSPNNNIIRGIVRADINQDGCDQNDMLVPNIPLITTKDQNSILRYSNLNGEYSFFVGEGTYTTVVTPNVGYFTSNPISQDSNFIGFGNEDVVDFCLEPLGNFNDLTVSIVPTNQARPGLEAHYKLVYENVGTTILSGAVELNFVEGQVAFLEATPSETSVIGNTISWDYSNLNPFEIRTIEVIFDVAMPPIVVGDDVIPYTVTINPVNGDTAPDDNVFNLNQIVVNSFDPNDKQVLEGNQVLIEDADEYLHYVVRFQNTGTASAINVHIEDALDEKLDWTTLRILDASHLMETEVVNGIIDFIFDDINLPTVTSDPEGSHGFVAFKVKPMSTVQLNDVVVNSADIYFDFNAAIVTNTVFTTFVDELSVSDFETLKIIAYPNPASDILNIQAEGSISSIEVMNLLGQRLLISKGNSNRQQIEISGLSAGNYFVKVFVGDISRVLRVVKK